MVAGKYDSTRYPHQTVVFSGDGGPATAAELDYPEAEAVDKNGNIYIVDEDNNRVREITGSILTDINQAKGESEKVKVYPNPSNGVFTVFCHPERSEGSQFITVYNIMGESVLTETLHSAQGNNLIDLSDKANGIYFYRVIANNGKIIGEGKIVVQK